MAAAVEVFRDNALERARLEAEQAKEREARERRAQALEALIGEFERTITGVVQTVSSAATELQANAETMSATAEQTSRQAVAVASAAEQTTANVQTVTSAAEELNSSTGEIGRQVPGLFSSLYAGRYDRAC